MLTTCLETNTLKTFGLVLSGGLSSRMHINKSELIWKGKTLLEHSCTRMLEAGCDEVLVSYNGENKSQSFIHSNYHKIVDRFKSSGPLAGIESAVNYCLSIDKEDSSKLLIMPVDMPAMSIERLSQLIDHAKKRSDETDVFYYDAGRFPILLRVTDTIHENLTQLLQNSNATTASNKKHFSIKNFLGSLTCEILDTDVEIETESEFYNCNTPEQWAHLSKQQHIL